MTCARRVIPCALAAALTATGCGGYFPLRFPARALWAPTAAERQAIQLPSDRPVDDYPLHQTQDQVSAGIELLSAEQSQKLLGFDLLHHDVQPAALSVANSGGQTYRFSKTSFNVPTIPAEQAAGTVEVGSSRAVLSHIRWLAFLPPGIVFSSLIEPLTTFDFPGIQEAATRPPLSGNAALRKDFAQLAFPEATIGPYRRQIGLVFLKPVASGSPLVLTLENDATHQPLVFAFTVPVDIRPHVYAHPYDEVWETTVKAIEMTPGWKIQAKDEQAGTITLRGGEPFFVWEPPQLMFLVQRIDERKTQVGVQLVRRGVPSPVEKLAAVDLLFMELSGQLPNEPPKKVTTGSTNPATGTLPRAGTQLPGMPSTP